MKYRLVELLRCPSHPEAMLRVTSVQVSGTFPYSGELQNPVCRIGCGFLGNWFLEIPESLPPSHRMECRRCLGTEMEQAVLTCPDCDWTINVVDGVLQSSSGPGNREIRDELQIHPKVGDTIDKYLSLEPGDVILNLAPLPEGLLEKWCSQGIESLNVEMSLDLLVSRRAKSCTNGHGTMHYLEGPLEIPIIRPGFLDGVVSLVPPDRIARLDVTLKLLPEMLRPSGRLLLLVPRDRSNSGSFDKRLENLINSLPESFNELTGEIKEARGLDLVLLKHPEPEIGIGLDEYLSQHRIT